MSKSTRGMRVAGVASLAVTLSIGVAAPAFAVDGFELTRLAGDDRYETAAEVGDEYGAKPDAIIANGQPGEFADALAGNYLAGAVDAPILLTKRSGLPGATTAQLEQQNVENVWVLGGTAAVPQEQVDQLEADGYNVTRIAGDNRYGTNAEVLAEGGAATDGVGVIATGRNFPDALAAGPFAYQGHSLGLVQTDSVPDAVGDALEADGVEQVLIFGGTDVVGPGVVADLTARGIEVLERFAGADRSETSELAAEWALENLGFSDAHVGVASGYADGWGADALAGGPLEGKENAPMLITRNVENPDDVEDYISAHSDTLTDGHIYGGPAAISAAAEAAMEAAGQGEDTGNQDFAVSPAGAQENTTSTDSTTDEGAETFTFSNVSGDNLVVATVPCDNVSSTEGGTVTFADAESTGAGSGEADGLGETETGNAVIEQINGAAPDSSNYDDTVSAVNGNVSVVVDSDTYDCAAVVLFSDTDNDGELDLDANNQPTEPFAIGGPVRWLPPEAENGTDNSVTVVYVDKDRDFFVGDDDNLYNYEPTDLFLYNEDDYAISYSEWETALSVGDSLDTYTDELEGYSRSARSSFDLYNDIPGTPSNVSTAVGDFDDDNTTTESNDVRVTWSAPNPADGLIAEYNVYQDGVQVGTVDGDETSLVVEDLAPGTYDFTVSAVSFTNTEGDESAESEATVTAPPAPASKAGAPLSESASFQDNNSNGVVDGGDVLYVTFDEVMAAPNAGDSVTLEDVDGTQGEITNGLNATYTLSENARTLSITLTSAPVIDGVLGTVTGVNYPADAVDSEGVTDTGAENVDDEPLEWDIANSSDVSFGTTATP